MTEHKMQEPPEAETPEPKKPLTDSEGLRVSTVHDETPTEESVNSGAREAFEAELAADADEEAKKNEDFQKFLASR